MRPALFLSTWFAAAAITPACTCEEAQPTRPPITAPFADSFDRAELGPDWLATDPQAVRIVDGAIVVAQGYNHPLWLLRRLPRDARIEFDCWSNSPDGDLKVEVWGDGHSFATGDRGAAYTSTAYNFIFGGWRNTLSTLARLNEHGHDRKVRTDLRVVVGQKYHWTIARKDRHLDWSIDGQPFLSFDDPTPLDGENHSFFGINNWESDAHFDNLTVTPL
jgi:hypothetical protein